MRRRFALALVLASVSSIAVAAERDALDLLNPLLSPELAGWMLGAPGRMASDAEVREFTALADDVMRPIVTELIDDLIAGGNESELVSRLCFAFPVQVIAALLGLERRDHARFQKWTTDIVGHLHDPEQGVRALAELRYLLNVVKPRNFMPVHGEWRHLRAHAELGVESGVPREQVVLCEDGDVVDLVDGVARLVGHIRSRYVYVDGLAVGDVSESLLTERRILGDGGFIAATVVIDSVTGKVVGGPAISAKGFSEDPAAFDAVLPLITEALLRAAEEGITDPHQLQQIVRRTVGRWVNEKYRRRPMIVPNVVEV